MQLQYFSLQDDKDSLKAKYKKLALRWHPDKNLDNQEEATRVMQTINAELAYCIKQNNFLKYNGEYVELYSVADFINETLSKYKKDDVFGIMKLSEIINDMKQRDPKFSNPLIFLKEVGISFTNVAKEKR